MTSKHHKQITSQRTKKMNISGIRKAFELAQKIKEPVNLSIGQPDFSTPEKIKQSAQQAITENKNSYSLTFGIPKLRQKVAEKLRKENKIKWATQDNTIITSAVSGGLSVVLPTLIDSGDEVIIFDPYFKLFRYAINATISGILPDATASFTF